MIENVCSAGHRNANSARFCGTCGESLTVSDFVSEVEPLEVEQPPLQQIDSPAIPVVVPNRQDEAPKTSARRRPWLIAGAVGIIALTGIAGGAYVLITTPAADVIGMTESQAVEALTDQGLNAIVSDRDFSDLIPKGAIAQQEPAPGARVMKGHEISLVISRGPSRTVPNVEGFDVGNAASRIKEASLISTSIEESSESVPEGQVIRQSPREGTELEDGGLVALVVSAGPPRTTLTFIKDLSSIVTSSTFGDCRLAVSIWQITYPRAVVQNQAKTDLSSISGRWDAFKENGKYYPCYAIGTFPGTSTSEQEYRIVFEPDKPENNRSRWFSRNEMVKEDWTLIN